MKKEILFRQYNILLTAVQCIVIFGDSCVLDTIYLPSKMVMLMTT